MNGRLMVGLFSLFVIINFVSGGPIFRGAITVRNQRNRLANDAKNEMVLLMAPYANWEQFLIPAPLTVKIMAKILQVSLEKDFSLEDSKPLGGFTHIRHPSSFRASLVQVAGDGHRAFSIAQGSMDMIRLTCHGMPNHFKEAMKILFEGDEDDVENLMPIPLNALSDGIDTCQREVDKVKNKFDDVQDLLRELLEVCTTSKGSYEKKLAIAKIKADRAKKQRKIFEDRVAYRNKIMSDLKAKQDKAEKDWKDAVEKIPSGSEILGMQVAEVLIDGLGNFLTLIPDFLTTITGGSGNSEGEKESNGSSKSGSNAGTEKQELPKDATNMILEGQKVVKFAEQLKRYFTYETIPHGNGTKGMVFHSTANLQAELVIVKDELGKSKRIGEAVKSDAQRLQEFKSKLIAASQEGIGLATEIEGTQENFSGKISDTLYQRIAQFHQNAVVLSTLAGLYTGESPLGSAGPNSRRAEVTPTTNNGKKSAAQHAIEQANVKVAQYQAHMDNTRKQFEASQAAFERDLEKLDNIMAEMDEAVQGTIDFEKIKMVLSKGIVALGELSEKWSKLAEFFTMMKTLIDAPLREAAKKFVQYSGQMGEKRLRLGGMSLKQMHQDTVYNNAYAAIKYAYLVEHIASAYVKVSSQHILSRIAGIGQIVGYDPVTERHLIEQKVQEITDGCDEASEQIRTEMIQHKNSFDQKINRRIETVKRELKEVLPTPPPQVASEISAIATATATATAEYAAY